MGNHPSKERQSTQFHPTDGLQHYISSSSAHPSDPSASERPGGSRRRSSRHDLSIFNIPSRGEVDPASPEARKETKMEREARKLEKERALRQKDRERSIREEGVDGGYLVTLGVYTGTEDFSKPTVRRMQIERRLAPFWKGLNDHDDSWTDSQLLSNLNGVAITSDDTPAFDVPSPIPTESIPVSSSSNIHTQTVPVPTIATSFNDTPSLYPLHPAFADSPSPQPGSLPSFTVSPSSLQQPDWPTGLSNSPSSIPFFRGRAKTLASLSSLSKNNSSTEIIPQEVQLSKDPYVNGQQLDIFLYKNASECPICFIYYPPYLNKTRCCDQPICSECFVQIKRPDPHPPEHHDDDNANTDGEPQEATPRNEEYSLVSEPATCPYCKVPEFGVSYEPPPFRRGLSYTHQHHLTSAMSSSSSIASSNVPGHSRRRNQSLSVDAPSVVTTDHIRPDWAKKLADARAHALRRAAAATALHNAAYVLGNGGEGSSRFSLGRRRRGFFGSEGDIPSHFQIGNVRELMAAADRQQQAAREAGAAAGQQPGNGDLFPGRSSSRRNRIDTLEDLMMMEAIRQSLAAEEERKKKDEKEKAKQAKKDEKQKVKETKKMAKSISRNSSFPAATDASPSPVAESSSSGKGKEVSRPTDSATPLSTSMSPPPLTITDSSTQQSSTSSVPMHRQLSSPSSIASSISELPTEAATAIEFGPNGSRLSVDTPAGTGLRSETPPSETLINFRSLAEVIDDVENNKSPLNSGSQSPLESSTTVRGLEESGVSQAPTIVAGEPIGGSNGKLPVTETEAVKTNNGKGKATVI